MTRENRLAIKEERLARLKQSSKNIKCGGVVKKLERQVRNEKAASAQ